MQLNNLVKKQYKMRWKRIKETLSAFRLMKHIWNFLLLLDFWQITLLWKLIGHSSCNAIFPETFLIHSVRLFQNYVSSNSCEILTLHSKIHKMTNSSKTFSSYIDFEPKSCLLQTNHSTLNQAYLKSFI